MFSGRPRNAIGSWNCYPTSQLHGVMASATPFEDLTADFTCPICLEWFWEPVALPCGHLYCQACIDKAWRTLGSEAICPQCRKQFPERSYTLCQLLGTLIHRIRKISPGEAEEGRCSEATRTESVPRQNYAQFPGATKPYKVLWDPNRTLMFCCETMGVSSEMDQEILEKRTKADMVSIID